MKYYLILVLLSSTIISCLGQNQPAYFVNKKYDLQGYIGRSFKFPEKARKQGLQTVLLLTFSVNRNGYKDSVQFAGSTGGIDSLMLDAFKKMVSDPEFKWKPATQNGKPKSCYVAIPISIVYEFSDERLEGEFLQVESYQGGYRQIMNLLYKLQFKYQLCKNIILMHMGASY
ncbi:energy transducer TonB [Mucilaginibacter terrae]|uniref:energy transducer TonB n=1 Tax=Mucilaginibacter terrae TaxID=1955052 RepID=UPI00362513DC